MHLALYARIAARSVSDLTDSAIVTWYAMLIDRIWCAGRTALPLAYRRFHSNRRPPSPTSANFSVPQVPLPTSCNIFLGPISNLGSISDRSRIDLSRISDLGTISRRSRSTEIKITSGSLDLPVKSKIGRL